MFPRNAASPPRLLVGAVVQISDGAVQSSGVSVAVRPEGGSESAGGGTVSYGGSSGAVYYAPTQAETDYTAFVVTAYKTGCIPVGQTVVTTASSTAGQVDVKSVGGTAQTARDLGASVLLSSGTGTGQVKLSGGYVAPNWGDVGNPTTTVGLSGTTVGVLTTYTGNTPQTGDAYARVGATGSGLTSLAPASTALSTATWSGTLATNLGTLASHDPGATLGTSTLTQSQVSGGAYALNSSSFAFNAALDFTTAQKAATLARVTLVDTTTANTDMRGTNSAALAATALSTVTWTGTRAGYLDNLSAGAAALEATAQSILTDTGTTLQGDITAILADTNELQTNQGNWVTATGFSTHSAADVWAVATRVLTAGTNIALAKGTGVTGFNDLSAAQVNAEADTALADYDAPTKAELDAAESNIRGADSDTLKTLSDQIDGLATAAAPQLLVNTTIATLASQTSFTLTAGSADDDAYNGGIIVVTDQSTATQKAVGSISDYVGSTKTITLSADPVIFTMAVGDTVDILAAIGSAPTVAQIRTEMDNNSTKLAAIVADTNELQTDWANGGRLDLILDATAPAATALSTAVWTGTKAGYLDAAVTTRMATFTQPTGFLAATFPGTVASPTNITAATGVVLSGVTHTGAVIPRVTLTDTTTTNTDMRGTDSAALAATALSTAVWTSTVAGRIDAAITTRLAPTTSGRTLDVTATGAAGIDWGNVENQGATVLLDDTSITFADSVGGVQGGVDVSGFSVGAIQSGLATASDLATVDTVVDAIKLQTDNLPSSQMPNTLGKLWVLDGDGNAVANQATAAALPNAAAVATAVLAAGDIDGYSLDETLKLCLAALAGKLSGNGTATVTIRSADDTVDRVIATIDGGKNRTAVTLNAAG